MTSDFDQDGSEQRVEEGRNHFMESMKAINDALDVLTPYEADQTDPRRLRGGINMAQLSLAALVSTLIIKGFITEEEYIKALVDVTDSDLADYQDRVNRIVSGATSED